jgi:hypothetical protein
MAGERWRMPAAVATGGMTVSAIALYAVAALAPVPGRRPRSARDIAAAHAGRHVALLIGEDGRVRPSGR